VIRLAGVSFRVEPASALTKLERRYLDGLEQAAGPPENDLGNRPVFHLVIAPGKLEIAAGGKRPEPGLPAQIEWADGRARVRHHGFEAELDPAGCRGTYSREGPEPFGLEIALKAALACRLPLEGGLPLHAAGIAIEERGHVFFGPSGAGKSTLSGLSPFPVLSDEMVAVTGPAPFSVEATGFWGTLDRNDAPRGKFPLKALYELHKGSTFALERLAPSAAFRRLMEVILVPPAPELWSAVMEVAGRLCQAVPVYRMTWSPSEPPWEEIRNPDSRSRP
jgi:hypothetical protein